MFTRMIFLITTFLLSACAPMMTKQDVEQIKKTAVINNIKNEMAFFNRGLTIFGNSSSKVDISEWKLSEYVLDSTIKSVKSKHSGIMLTHVLPTNSDAFGRDNKSFLAYMEKLKSQGYDTVIIIRNAGIYSAAGGGSDIAPSEAGGFIFYTTSFMKTKFRVQLFPQVAYSLYSLTDNKILSYATNSMVYPKQIETIAVKPFEQYTPQEKEAIKQEFIKNIDATLDKSITQLFTVPR